MRILVAIFMSILFMTFCGHDRSVSAYGGNDTWQKKSESICMNDESIPDYMRGFLDRIDIDKFTVAVINVNDSTKKTRTENPISTDVIKISLTDN